MKKSKSNKTKQWFTFSPRMTQVIVDRQSDRVIIGDVTRIRAVKDGSLMKGSTKIGRKTVRLVSTNQGRIWNIA